MFDGCYYLESVRVKADTPPFMNSTAFPNYNIPLYVPDNSIETYKETDPWSQFTTILPLSTADMYKLIYLVDGAEYKTYDVLLGTAITPEPIPAKEGYTFSGWSEIPATMPAHDVTVTGTFTVNKYKLTYTVDGQEYKSSEVEYGASITPEAAPAKEGYTFSGWSDIPETMPAHDVVVKGTFERNFNGEGTEGYPYLIRKDTDLTRLSSLVNAGESFAGKYLKVSDNIDMTGISFAPIGNQEHPFSGNFDGGGYVIKGISIDATSYIGLFGNIESAFITDVGVEDLHIYGSSYIGGIAGYSKKSTITNCYTRGHSLGNDCVGALVGFSGEGTIIQNCFSSMQHTKYEIYGSVGGLVGYNCGKLENSYFYGTINAKIFQKSTTGGIVGYNHTTGSIHYCYFIKYADTMNGDFNYCGSLNWGDCNNTDSFDLLGITTSGYNLHSLLNKWVVEHSSEGRYKKWTNNSFPSLSTFIEKYQLTYVIDDEEYKTYEIFEGSSINPENIPTKEGYTFSGWSEIPATMPAHDVTVTGTFTVNKYKLTYTVDGQEYESSEVEYGASITPETAPTKEGYTFSGWSEIPATMPAHDVTIAGTFTINKYKLTYTVDGQEYKSSEVEYGATITPEAAPTKEGYTFSGWSEIPATMPAHDVTVTGTFTINKYKLTYMVDGEVYKSYEIEYGAVITPEAEPTKEGHTFSGWGNIPQTMPAHDVTVTGTFTKGAYKLIYMVDGEVFKTISYDFGATIIPETAPAKDGYTFSGWSEIPATMPAHDVTVTGTFTINKYKLTYMVDGVVYKSFEIDYGTAITPEAAPTKEGHTFSGWSWIPSKMPAEDVTVSGTFSVNRYKLTYMIDDKVYKEVTYEYGAKITPEPKPEGDYATFAWTDLPETMPAHDVVVHATYTTGIGELMVTGQQNVKIFSPNGKQLSKPQKGVNIIRMSDGTIRKVTIR